MMLEAPGIYGPRKDRLVAYYSMDAGYREMNAVLDSTTNNNDGTATTGATTGTGYINEGMTLDGSSQIVLQNLGLSGDQTVSISAWINIDPTAPDRNDVVGWGTEGTDDSVCALRTNGDGSFMFYFWGHNLTVSCPAYYGTWTHVVAVYDAFGDARRIWVNGVQEGSDTPTGTASFDDGNYSIGNFAGNGYLGSIDEVRIYDYPLFGAQIDELFNQ